MTRAVAALSVDEDQFGFPAHDDLDLLRVFDSIAVIKLYLGINRRLDTRLFGASLHGTADMERPHSQLRTRLADRLRRNDADRFANVDTRTAGEVATVARGADPFLGLTGEDRTDTH